jgi:predicted ATPase/class 3 adenylate cyclase
MMLALYRVGRQADALRAYQQVRNILGEQLGVEPTPELRRLEEHILRQSAELAAPPGPGSAAAPAAPRLAADMVAFLFTDIEASTRRWESDQEAMASDLTRHDALLLEAVEAHGGDAFSHTGDGFCVAFPTVPAAMAAAVTMQQRLLETAWSSSAPLKVRMAVHAGAAERRAGNWFGPTLNRTARLMATAAGGQVVCSHVAAELAEDDVPSGAGLVDLGEHRLADLTRPERIYQLTHSDLASDFPPLRSLDARRHNLPVALTTFVGREDELNEVLSLLGSSRLVTLVGTGGAGKTRLALQAAAGALRQFPDGAWFVELAPVRDPELVADEAVTALGFLPSALVQPGDSLEVRLCDQLEMRRLLLVLDNCEHVVDAAARLAHTVLARCPDVTVLATSREVLGVPAEVVWNVPPLSMPSDDVASAAELAGSDAVMLFCERARANQPGFGLSDANAAAVARICRRLDGIPLGLELAAAKIRVLGAHQVAERLDDRFRLLTGGSRTAVPRHQTLQAAMDWGYTLLPEPEQVVLRRLAVFRGSFSLAAVEAVAGSASEPGGDLEVLELLSRLVDKSMVAVTSEEPDVRYNLLETVREYAGQKLSAAGEADEIRTRHRDFYLDRADRWAARAEYWDWWLWIRQISADVDNFRAALEWSAARGDDEALLRLAAAHWPHWYWGEGLGWREWLPEALRRCERPSAARVEALLAVAHLRLRSGEDHEGCRQLFREAKDLAVGLASDELIARVGFYEAHVLLSNGELRKARALVDDALRRSHNSNFIGWCHWALGWIALREERLDDAAVEFRTGLQRGIEVHDEAMQAHVAPGLALVAALQGDHEAARTMATQGVQAAERTVGAARVLMLALALAGQVALLSGDEGAAGLTARLLEVLHDKGVTDWADESLALSAVILSDRFPEEAAVILNASGTLQESLHDTGNQLAPVRARLRQCHQQLVEALGPGRWQDAEQRGRALPTGDAIVRARAALGAFAPHG